MNLLAPPAMNTDALSPMLVKELRQGMKSRSFSFSFLLMQLLMVFCMLMAVTAQAARSSSEFAHGLFWFCIGATLVFITPLRAMSALQQEIKGNTLELIFLTRLGAWRIVAGKWTALYSQALLLTTAALPYLLIRYFMGGIDVAEDLVLLIRLLASSAALTAIGVCISTTRAQWMRGLTIALAVMSPYLIGIFAARSVRSMSGGSAAVGTAHPWLMECIHLLYAALVTVLALSWSAGRIAPDAENHARWKRLTALAIVALLPVAAFAGGDGELALLGLFVLMPVCADALCEAPRPIPSLYAPFVRRGLPGTMAGYFLIPGWPNGLLFTLLLLGAYSGVIAITLTHPTDSQWGLLASAPGALLFPAALILTFRPRTRRMGVAYFVIVMLCFVISMIGLALNASFSELTLMPLSVLPPAAFILHLFHQGSDLITSLTGLVSGIATVLLFVRLRRALAAQRQTMREALSDTA